MATRTVRITRTWDIEVEAEYGDTDEALIAKADTNGDDPDSEVRNLIPAEGVTPVEEIIAQEEEVTE
jgi:hypothetical protein